MTYDASSVAAPILTTRKINVKLAIAELLGYLKGFTSAAQFRELGCNSWNANANENQAWLANPNRKGEDDLGLIYGAVGIFMRPACSSIGQCQYSDVSPTGEPNGSPVGKSFFIFFHFDMTSFGMRRIDYVSIAKIRGRNCY